MYLKRLEVKGFKSFADHTEINLNPGINIIVGPNGCGKSNLVDAIRWVLGESNIRNLRGQSAEDVIFNGTDSKRALGLASVSASIDNCDHILPVDFDEVAVSRKVYRSGESEFYINKSRVRLKDINHLFTGTGLGKKGYSIISQGELEQVLNGQAFDRRLILEEASGIIRYRQQRDEVNRRLATTSSDLERAGDILTELLTRQAELQTKAEKARTCENLTRECTTLEKQVLAFECVRLRQELNLKNQDLQERQADCAMVEKELQQKQADLTQAETELEQVRVQLAQFKDKKYEAETRLNNLQGDLKINQEKIKNWQERIASAARDEAKYCSLLEKLNQDLELAMADYEREKESCSQRTEEVRCLQHELTSMEKHSSDSRTAFEQFRKKVSDQLNRLNDLKKDLTAVEQSIQEAQGKKERLQIHLEELNSKIESTDSILANINMEHARGAHAASSARLELDKTGERKRQLESQKKEAEDEYQTVSRDLMNLESRLDLIRNQEKNYAGYSEAVRLIMKATRQKAPDLNGVLGVLGELVEVPAGLELAIETAAGKGLENIVVAKGEQARRAIEYVKSKRLGRLTFLPLDLLKVSAIPAETLRMVESMEGVVGIASRLVKFDARYRKAVEYMLGRVLIVADLDKSLNIYKNLRYPLRLVTLEGDTINLSGAMSGGSNKNRGISPIQLKKEEKGILEELAARRQRLEAVSLRAAEIANQLQEAALAHRDSQERFTRIGFQNQMLAEQLSQLTDDLKNARIEKEQYIKEMGQLQQQLHQLEQALETRQVRLRQMEDESHTFTEELEKRKAALEVDNREYEVKRERLNSYVDQLEMKKRELVNIQKNIKQLEQVQTSYRESLEQATALQERLNTDVDQESARVQTISADITRAKIQKQTINQELQAIQAKEREGLLQIETIQQELRPPRQKIDELQAAVRSLELSIVRFETELNSQLERWQERFEGEPPEEVPEKQTVRDIRAYKQRISLLYDQIEQLGPVDPGSIPEFEEVSQRCDFLGSQFQDLQDARESLTTLLKSTEELMVQEFAQFLLLAQESFNYTFKGIFNGGEASLTLDKGAAFDAGIDISVKMPGKRTQSLNLLSGGERALTCIAFIFSLLRLRPAPFCLMDEIDASLDEINLARFCKFLQDMATEIQFIVITHRQVTIQAGENVYGVTMPEEGISSVLSISMSDAESMAG